MSPSLYPAFDPSISDYVVASASGGSVQVSVDAPRNTKVSVDGQPFRKLSFTTSVNIAPGQSFSLVVNSPGSSTTYYVRCLPTDFPAWMTERPGISPAEFYIIAPNLGAAMTQGRYIIIVDGYGVPVWWYHASGIDAKLLPNGNLAWLNPPIAAEEHRLDGSLVRTLRPTEPPDVTMDNHELQLLPNGNYLVIVDEKRGPVDLSPYGGSPTATVLDNIIEELTPNGALVWSWSAMDHIPVSETEQQWWQQYLVNASPADPYHMNAVEPDGDGMVVSLRHLDALIRIDKASGNIVWKLSGTPRPESLTILGDPYGNFGGQHDARILSDGTLTLHDNGTHQGRAPRAVHYRIDTTARTATFIEPVSDA
jgi:hypothetical protein